MPIHIKDSFGSTEEDTTVVVQQKRNQAFLADVHNSIEPPEYMGSEQCLKSPVDAVLPLLIKCEAEQTFTTQ